MSKHTKELWKVSALIPGNAEIYQDGIPIARFRDLKHRDRVIVEHNALAGIPTKALEAGAIKVAVAAFWKYGRHHYDCTAIEDATAQCSCGVRSISSALAGLKPEPEGE